MTTRDRILLSLLLYQGKTSYQKIYSFLPPGYEQPNFYAILRRMESDQLIKRSIMGITSTKGIKSSNPNLTETASDTLDTSGTFGTYSLRLGPDALSFLESRFGPRIRSLLSPSNLSNPSQQFSLIIYDFPLSMAYRRARLQTKLERLGMGMLRKGVYISPYDILGLVASWAEENKVLEHIYLIRSDLSAHRDQTFRRSFDKIWNLEALTKQYITLMDRLAIVKGQQIPEKRVSGLKRIKSDFLELVSRDPMLPKPLIPPNWPLVRVAEALISID